MQSPSLLAREELALYHEGISEIIISGGEGNCRRS